jgi:predicted component of type VI protein secretion system
VQDVPTSGFQLQVVIERFEEAIAGITMSVEHDLLIGRCPNAGLIIDGRLVSRQHVYVRAAGSGLEIEDVSSNGTLVDGSLLLHGRRRVAKQCKLLVGTTRLWLQRVRPPAPAMTSAPPPLCYPSTEPTPVRTQILGSEPAPKKRALFSAAGGVRSDSPLDLLIQGAEDYTEL